MTDKRKGDIAVITFVLAVLLGGGFLVWKIDDANDRDRVAQLDENCRTGHANRSLERHFIVRDYQRFIRENQARFLNDPDGTLTELLRHSTRINLKVREGNRRLPRYCKAYKVPEDQRFWPRELRDKDQPGSTRMR